MTPPNPSTSVGVESGETQRQAAELAAMQRMIDASRDCFSLSVAVCNSPALRDYLIGDLCKSFPAVRTVTVPAETVDVFGHVVEEVDDSALAGLFVVNLEASIHSTEEDHPTIRSLNASRELWERTFRCPVVFWLPEYAATLLSIHARDFWRYRSHRFEFVSEQASAAAGLNDRSSDNIGLATELSAEEKQFRIAELEQRIEDVGEDPPKNLAIHTAVWLRELGLLYRFVGDLDRAEQMFRRALEIEERFGQEEGMARNYGNLGAVYYGRGDLDEAEQMHRDALQINERLGRQEGMAGNYCNLGAVYATRGDLNRAEEMCRKALEISKRLGRKVDIADDYHNLATVYLNQGNPDQAEETLLKALEMHEQLGRKERMAIDYSNLSMIYETRGDLDRTEQMCRKSLEINKQLGAKEGMANNYSNLGVVYQTRGDLDQAEEMHRKSLEINKQLGFKEHVAGNCQNLGIIAEKRGEISRATELWTKARDLLAEIGIARRVEQIQKMLDSLQRTGPASVKVIRCE